MKRSGPPARRKPLEPGTGLSRTSSLSSVELDRRQVHTPTAPRGRERAPGAGKTRPAHDLTKAIREQVYERDDHACVRCGRGLFAGNRSVQHRSARGMGSANPDPHALSNLIAVCGAIATTAEHCHFQIESWRLNAQAGGWAVPMGQDPRTWSVRYSDVHGGGLWLLDDDGNRERVA